jgi:hypothetical protein
MDWISVDDQLPEPEVPVLAIGQPYSNHGTMIAIAVVDEDARWFEADDDFGWVDTEGLVGVGFNDIEYVTHWMPIPPTK